MAEKFDLDFNPDTATDEKKKSTYNKLEEHLYDIGENTAAEHVNTLINESSDGKTEVLDNKNEINKLINVNSKIYTILKKIQEDMFDEQDTSIKRKDYSKASSSSQDTTILQNIDGDSSTGSGGSGPSFGLPRGGSRPGKPGRSGKATASEKRAQTRAAKTAEKLAAKETAKTLEKEAAKKIGNNAAKKIAARVATRTATGALGATGFGAPAAVAIAIVTELAFAAVSGVDGWYDAANIMDKKEEDLNFTDKVSAALGTIVGDASFGLIDNKETAKDISDSIETLKMKDQLALQDLQNKGIIDYDIIGKSEIKDWNKVKELNTTELKSMIALDDWSTEDAAKLIELLELRVNDLEKTLNDINVRYQNSIGSGTNDTNGTNGTNLEAAAGNTTINNGYNVNNSTIIEGIPDTLVKQESISLKPYPDNGNIAIGMGYNVTNKDRSEVERDFNEANIPLDKINKILNKTPDGVLTLEEAHSLAKVGYKNHGIEKLNKMKIDYNSLTPEMQEVAGNLAYRGDLKRSGTGYQKDLYDLVQKNDTENLYKFIESHPEWKNDDNKRIMVKRIMEIKYSNLLLKEKELLTNYDTEMEEGSEFSKDFNVSAAEIAKQTRDAEVKRTAELQRIVSTDTNVQQAKERMDEAIASQNLLDKNKVDRNSEEYKTAALNTRNAVGDFGKKTAEVSNSEIVKNAMQKYDSSQMNNVVKGKPSVNLDDLNPEMKKNVSDFANAYYEKYGEKLQINSGYRSPEYQQELLDAEIKKRGSEAAALNWVGSPGGSMHNNGYAVDINSSQLNKAHKDGLLKQFNLHRPLPHENWHLELKGIDRQAISKKGKEAWKAKKSGKTTETPEVQKPNTTKVDINKAITEKDDVLKASEVQNQKAETENVNSAEYEVNKDKKEQKVQLDSKTLSSSLKDYDKNGSSGSVNVDNTAIINKQNIVQEKDNGNRALDLFSK